PRAAVTQDYDVANLLRAILLSGCHGMPPRGWYDGTFVGMVNVGAAAGGCQGGRRRGRPGAGKARGAGNSLWQRHGLRSRTGPGARRRGRAPVISSADTGG